MQDRSVRGHAALDRQICRMLGNALGVAGSGALALFIPCR
jgi:hypothetical protein